MCAAQSNPAKEFVAYNMLKRTPKLGDHPVSLVMLKSEVTRPELLAHANRLSRSRNATTCTTNTRVSGMFICLPHVILTTQERSWTQTAETKAIQTWYSPV
jgi:hypothetical protein